MNRNDDYQKSPDWLRFRKHWLQDNPPLDNHAYICGICGRWILEEEVTLDHIHPRTADNMFQPDNIQPAHGICNYRKGSRRLTPVVTQEEYDFLSSLSDM